MKKVSIAAAAAAMTVLVVALAAPPATAKTLTLKLHSFGSPKQPEKKWIFDTLKADLEKHSGGTLSMQVYFGMALGGKPRDLISQAKNGVVDMSYTLPAYHAGRFPILTGIELPFIASTGEAMSQTTWDWVDKHAYREFKDVRLVTLNAIDIGILHTTKRPVRRLEDLKGLKIRVAGRFIGMAVKSLGGVPVQMPLPSVYESLARGQTQGMMIPWLITIPFKLLDVTKFHTDTPIYHSLLLIAMNNGTWNRLTAQHKKAFELSTGKSFAKRYGALWDGGTERGRAVARKKGNEIIQLSGPEEARWRAAARGAHKAWVQEMDRKGLNGKQMFSDLMALVKKYK